MGVPEPISPDQNKHLQRARRAKCQFILFSESSKVDFFLPLSTKFLIQTVNFEYQKVPQIDKNCEVNIPSKKN